MSQGNSPENPSQPPQPAPQPKFDPDAAHMQRPKLRAVRGFPAQMNGQMVLGLADARQISERVVFAPPAVQFILPHLTGERSLDEVVSSVGKGLTRAILEGFIAQLDDAGLIEGPKAQAMIEKMRRDFDSLPTLPPASTAAFAEAAAMQEFGAEPTEEQKASVTPEVAAAKLVEVMDLWMSKALENAENPSFDELPRAIVAPHIDYPRGWFNYASVWGRMRVVDRPDRVIILGTNHHGLATGVTACDKGFQSPLGVCELDRRTLDALHGALGDALLANRYDHEREHSIELQIPWIQHCLGKDDAGSYCPIVGILVHDPTVNAGESYDGKGVGMEPFVAALKQTLSTLPGKTLVISSADLSHVGPAFGDQQTLAGDAPEAQEFRNRVFQHDIEMLGLIEQNKPEDLITSMTWQQNPTRWCSIGSLVATLRATGPKKVQRLNYAAAMDEQGMGMVSSAAVVMS